MFKYVKKEWALVLKVDMESMVGKTDISLLILKHRRFRMKQK